MTIGEKQDGTPAEHPPSVGSWILAGLRSFAEALESGESIPNRFRCTTISRDTPTATTHAGLSHTGPASPLPRPNRIRPLEDPELSAELDAWEAMSEQLFDRVEELEDAEADE